jgi:hypothetical protein
MATEDFTPQRTAPLTELGRTGLRQYGGFIRDDPDQRLNGRILRGELRALADSDPIAGAMLKAITMQLMQTARMVQPASKKLRDRKDAEFTEGAFGDMSAGMDQNLQEICTMLTFGFSLLETVYKERHGANPLPGAADSKYSDGKIGWRKWAPRSQESLYRWVFDDSGGLQGIEQHAPPDFRALPIPISRLLLFRTETTKNNPEGRSIFRSGLRAAYFKRNIEQIEAIGIERDLAGLPTLGVPLRLLQADASDADKALLADMVALLKAIRRDENEGVIYPLVYDEHNNQMVKLELLTSGGQRQFDTDQIVLRYDQRLAMTYLADFLLIGHEKVGSFALSSTKAELFTSALRALLVGIEAVINDYAIPRLFALNGMVRDAYPALRFGTVRHIDLALLADAMVKLRNAGAQVLPSRLIEDALLDRLGLPIPPDDDRPDTNPKQPVVPAQPGGQPADGNGNPTDKPQPGDAPGGTGTQRPRDQGRGR